MKRAISPLIQICMTGLLSLALLLPGARALADDHTDQDEPIGYRSTWPPLPERGPRVLPQIVHDETITAATQGEEKWIDVDLSEQRVVAYENGRPIRSFTVSTGIPGYHTRVGVFRIWTATRIQDMDGDNPAAADYYFLPDVEWVQYFDGEIAFHGAYWHDNFGTPMSRGCVNMRNEDAQWLFEWSNPWYDMDGPAWQMPTSENPGTLVVVRP
ncbi:MAG: L,D-transpeptidase [Caldilineaceae bacterium]|nr:L,D-transpeptidase [Caldilineaceae bacterium]